MIIKINLVPLCSRFFASAIKAVRPSTLPAYSDRIFIGAGVTAF